MKKTFEEWVEGKYENRGSYWTSVKEKVEWGFAESDLSHYTDKNIKAKYNKYVNYIPKNK